ncbi:MAG: carbohydrate binding domain-containing protein, partial [bacterium]
MQIVRKTVKNWFTISLFLIFLAGLSFAEVLDSMDSSINWSVQTDNGASLSTSTVIGLTGNAIQLDYDINSGEWVAIKREDFANVDISSGDAVRFYYKGTGDSNHIKFQITDADGDVFDRKLADL